MYPYVASVIIAIVVLIKIKLMKISLKFLCCTALTVLYVIIWRLLSQENAVIGIILGAVMIIGLLVLYRKDIVSLIKGLKKKKSEG